VSYDDAIQFLYSLQVFGAKPGLENPRKLAALAGDPHQQLRFLHVAGTNGKGSVCAMIESIYRQSGLKTGLFTSPHLVSFSERIQVNRRPIPEDEVARLTGRLQELCGSFPRDHHPTFFEVVTVMGLLWFAEQECDLVIWETGMGGRLDSTNIVTPLASVITSIGRDHQQWLGSTVAEIAFEKAGIIKRGVPVITGVTQPEALAVISEEALRKDAPLAVVPPESADAAVIRALKLALEGDHQRLNAALAVSAVQILREQLPVSLEQIQRGLETVHWPGRLQRAALPDGRRVLLDGAHNPEGIESLARVLARDYLQDNPALILGVLADKEWPCMCERLAPLFQSIHLVPVHSSRSTRPEDLLPVCQAGNPAAQIQVHSDLAQALAGTATEPLVVITGSLYLVGEAMERLGICPTPSVQERTLNEWSGSSTTAPPSKALFPR
jgi:dihydrofolate synthase / folylpolyglutamate synthase